MTTQSPKSSLSPFDKEPEKMTRAELILTVKTARSVFNAIMAAPLRTPENYPVPVGFKLVREELTDHPAYGT